LINPQIEDVPQLELKMHLSGVESSPVTSQKLEHEERVVELQNASHPIESSIGWGIDMGSHRLTYHILAPGPHPPEAIRSDAFHGPKP
jgi:hypothetical protein